MLKFLIFVATVANCRAGIFDGFFGDNSIDSIKHRGNSKGNGDSRIVGGETSPVHYPYQLSLQMQTRGGGGGFFFFQQPSSNFSHFCGASILNENFFVTAAHCIDGFNQSRMSVLAGTNDLREEAQGSRHLVDNCIIHPEYVELNNSDVAVCRVQTPFNFGDNIAPIALSKDYVEGNVTCILTGWGYTSMIRGFPLPNQLQRANLPTLTNSECNEKGHSVGPREICTLSRFGQGACGGDSGGPLAFNGVLVGIVSYGTRVCAVSYPDVYTRASEFVVVRLDFQNFDMTAGGSKEILKINSEKPTQEEIWRIGRNISTDGQFLLHKTLLYHDSSWCENYQHSPWDYSIFPDPNICRLRETRIA